MTDRLHLATGTADVLAGLRRSLAGGPTVAPLPSDTRERERTLAMLQPDVAGPRAAAIVATSGSTGHPRGVVLPRTALLASAEATHARLDGPGTWVLALPPHYVAGLMVLVRSLVAGRAPLEVDSRLAGLPDLNFAGSGPHYVSLVPLQLARALTDSPRTAALRRVTAVLLGGAAADPRLLDRAADAGIRVVTTYGMSETCGGCVYDGRPLDGVEVAVDHHGRIAIGGPTLFAGYRLDPGATAETLVEGRLLTRDRGRLSESRLTVLGRLDDVVISGGLNVDLGAVERGVHSWAATLGVEAVVVGLPEPMWGTEVVAVVGDEGNPTDVSTFPRGARSAGETCDGVPPGSSLADLRAALSTDLPAYALPRRLVRRRSLPQTPGGKVDRRRLVAELSAAPQDES
ncbi:MAG: AMP-binding protein [Microlunatus sp.]|nr:AMP-binding protein [Microlunatus sp.]